MSAEAAPDLGLRILHPTDFSEASEVAFVHALKLTLAVQGRLHVLHVASRGGPVRWRSFPGVREALERWGMLPAGSPPAAVGDLGIEVVKVEAVDDDPVVATHDFLQRHPAELIVLATHQRDGLARWREPSVAERIARQAHQLTLFVPGGTDGFVDAVTGRIRLERILIPVDRNPAPQPEVEAAAALASLQGQTPMTFQMVHVGETEFPAMITQDKPGWTWERRVRGRRGGHRAVRSDHGVRSRPARHDHGGASRIHGRCARQHHGARPARRPMSAPGGLGLRAPVQTRRALRMRSSVRAPRGSAGTLPMEDASRRARTCGPSWTREA